MSCEVAALPFQANTNYGTWSIEFEYSKLYINILYENNSKIFFISKKG